MNLTIKEWISIIVFVATVGTIWGATSGKIADMSTDMTDLRMEVKELKAQRDGLIIVQTQQIELVKRLDKSDEKLDKIYSLVYSLSKP